MRILSGKEEKKALEFILITAEIAKNATCKRSKCGSIIVNNEEIIGEGYNSPPGNLESQRRCSNKKTDYDIKVTDKTCCIHAEQRAISDAKSKNNKKLIGSRLYFIRLDENDEPKRSGDPYCTICSKETLDAGIAEFTLWDKIGVCVYSAEEYNNLSFLHNQVNQ